MSGMKRYEITLTGSTPLIMHADNLAFSEKIRSWQRDPANKELSQAGDDRSPAWTWIGYAYHDDKHITMSADNIATCIREGGAKVPTGNKRGDKTYKKLSQSGIVLDTPEYELTVDGKQIPLDPIRALIGNNDFFDHMETAESLGFELFVKRAKVMMAKHVRVRPLFRNWMVRGTITILDEEMFGLSQDIVQRIFDQAGMFCGLGDWRPGSPKSPGFYGKFLTHLQQI